MTNEAASQLAQSVADGDAKALKAALADGADPNTRVRGEPALVAAINSKKKTLIKALIEAGADVNAPGREGMTPMLALAASVRDVKIGAMLLERGAKLDDRDTSNISSRTPLHFATQVKKLEFAEWLLKSGADIEAKDGNNGDTPLLLCCRSDSGVMSATELANARWLLDQGADPNAVNESGATALHLAADAGPADFVIELVQARGAKIVKNEYGSTPIFYCTSTHFKDAAVWDALLAAGDDVNAVDGRGRTPILAAGTSWNLTAIKYFVDKGADPKHLDDKGEGLRSCAESCGQTKILAWLDKAGV